MFSEFCDENFEVFQCLSLADSPFSEAKVSFVQVGRGLQNVLQGSVDSIFFEALSGLTGAAVHESVFTAGCTFVVSLSCGGSI